MMDIFNATSDLLRVKMDLRARINLTTLKKDQSNRV